MDSDATLADDPRVPSATVLRVGPYLITGRVAVFPGVEILTATHELTRARVVLRRLLPDPTLTPEEASLRLQAFQEDTRRRQALSDPRHLPLFDFARNPNEAGYQAFAVPDGARSVPRNGSALPLEEWTRIAAEAGAALQSLLALGIPAAQFDPSGLLIGPNNQVRIVPVDFTWPPKAPASATMTRALAGWLYQMLAGTPPPPSSAPASLCDLNPRVSAELDMTIRAAMNPYAVNAVRNPGEFARLLRDGDSKRGSADQAHSVSQPNSATNTWANAGAWAVLLALGGVTLGWLLALYFPRG